MQRYLITCWLPTGCADELGSPEAKVIVLKPALYIADHTTLRGISPPYLCSKFDFVHNHHSHATRNLTSNTLFIPKVNSNSGMRTFQVRSGHLWNSLAPTIRTDLYNMSISEFKTCLSTIST